MRRRGKDFGAEFAGEFLRVIGAVEPDGIGVRIEDPHFGGAVLQIQLALAVDLSGGLGFRDDFDR